MEAEARWWCVRLQGNFGTVLDWALSVQKELDTNASVLGPSEMFIHNCTREFGKALVMYRAVTLVQTPQSDALLTPSTRFLSMSELQQPWAEIQARPFDCVPCQKELGRRARQRRK